MTDKTLRIRVLDESIIDKSVAGDTYLVVYVKQDNGTWLSKPAVLEETTYYEIGPLTMPVRIEK